MFLQKIKSRIKYFTKKNDVNYRKREKPIKNKSSINNSKLVLNTFKYPSFIKKRRSFIIKNNYLEKLKIFWNNVTNYYLIIWIILLVIIIYIIFWPLFKIKTINIIWQDNITNRLIAYKSVEDYRWKSIWNVEKKDILKDLKNYQHNISDIKLDISLPSTIRININSYKWIFNTTINNKTFIITENWTLIPSSYSSDLSELNIKYDFDKSLFLDYKKVLEWKYITKISSTKKIFLENFINIKIKKLFYYEVWRELHITTEQDTTIIFDLDTDTKMQIEKLAIFNKEHLNIDKSNIVYIDLRINNKIFYCPIEEIVKCNKNIKSIYWE